MPPLPSTIDEETTRLLDTLARKEQDLSDFQIPRLRACAGPLSAQQRLAAELREDLDGFAQQVEKLALLADDQQRKADRNEVRRRAEELRASCARIRRDARAALLASKRAIDTRSAVDREALLRSAAGAEKPPIDEKATGDALMHASNDVTEALRRTLGTMQGELERSVLTVQMLESSTATLRGVSGAHDTLRTLADTSRALIGALSRADALDRLLVLGALAFFFLIVAYVLKQRVLDRGLRVALWWTRFVPDFSGSAGAGGKLEAAGMVAGSMSLAAANLRSSSLSASMHTASQTTTLYDGHESPDALEDALSSLSLSLPLPTGTAFDPLPPPPAPTPEPDAHRAEL